MDSFSSKISFAPDVQGNMEFRVHENRFRSYAMVNGQLVRNQDDGQGGMSARVIEDGLYGFSSIPGFAKDSMTQVIAQATQNARLLKERSPVDVVDKKTWAAAQAKVTRDDSRRPETWSGSQIVELLKTVDQKLQNLGSHITSRKVILREQRFDKEVWTGQGAHCQTSFTRSHLYMSITGQSAHGPVEIMRVAGGRGPIESAIRMQDIEAEINLANERLRDKMKGIYPEAGKATVILDSKLAGILAHEAIGHTTEADLVLGGSVAGAQLGKTVASPLVTLVDFAHTYNGETCPVPVFNDDEGIEGKDTVIIENGTLKTFMNSRETAAHFGQEATGHARAWAFNDEPLIRMRNTAILPGKDTLEDMIASIDNGYYLLDHSNGQADSTSEFMFGVTQGYEIKDGKLGKALLDTTISGIAFDMLKSVSMISNQMTWVDAGTCGKKQPMFVGMGGPAIKCEVNLGGR